MPTVKRKPLWEGPEGRGKFGGVTQSLIGRWLQCRTRFYLATIEGLRSADSFDSVIHYGHMWHLCEEESAAGRDWAAALKAYATALCRQYRTEQEDIDHWFRAVKTLFPEYLKHWASHPEEQTRVPIAQEQVFDHDYELPSGRVVRLRGKRDGDDLIGRGPAQRVWLFETKTKGYPDKEEIERQLSFDLQSMLYLVVVDRQIKAGESPFDDLPKAARTAPAGVRYNVVRRPFAGGAGSIRRKKPSKSNPDGESKDQFFERLRSEYVEPDRANWFMRWNSQVSPADLDEFRRTCLDPVLEQMCDWYDEVTGKEPFEGKPREFYRTPLHFRFPYGIRHAMVEGAITDYDHYLRTGSTLGLTYVNTMFGELE